MVLMKRTIFVLSLIIIFGFNCTFGAIVNWGEICEYTAECNDHRMVCEKVTNNNITRKLCICDRFHDWSGLRIGCVPKISNDDILAMLTEKYNISERIEYEAKIIFSAQIAAGLFVLGIGFLCSITVSIYCYRIWKQDTDLDDIVRRLESQRKNKATSSRPAR